MQFGFTLKPDHSIERTIALAKQAEAAGFDYGWLFDTHVLWRDPVSPADAHGPGDDATAPRNLRHEPGDPRAVGHRLRCSRRSTSCPAAGWTSASVAATRPGGCSASRRRR